MMSRAVESGHYTVRGPMELGATLRMGRPAKGAATGKTPALPVRLLDASRVEIKHRVKAREASSATFEDNASVGMLPDCR